jgi:fibronectin type 3 domain-containing protein
LTSTGTAAVTINSATIAGTGFTFSGATFPLTLNPQQAVTLEVTFAPTQGVPATGTLTISSTSSTNPTATVSLSGTGQYWVALSWSAPTTSPVPITGYNVYRSTGGSSTYTLLNTSVLDGTSYSDTNVQSGVEYSYYVESVAASGVQSTASQSVSVTIP